MLPKNKYHQQRLNTTRRRYYCNTFGQDNSPTQEEEGSNNNDTSTSNSNVRSNSNTTSDSNRTAVHGNLTRQEFIQKELDELTQDNQRMRQVSKDVYEKQVEYRSKHNQIISEVDHLIDRVNSGTENVSEVTKDYVNEVNDKFYNVKQSVSHDLDALNTKDELSGDEQLKLEHLLRGKYDADNICAKKITDAVLQDEGISQTSRDSIKDLSEQVKDCSNENKRLWDFKIYGTKELLDLENRRKNLESLMTESTNQPRNSSIIDDFADVSTEMPSYMDPED